ncbi:MAG: hypothetical protein ACRYHQ_31500 [Janthinobacterium lividum]
MFNILKRAFQPRPAAWLARADNRATLISSRALAVNDAKVTSGPSRRVHVCGPGDYRTEDVDLCLPVPGAHFGEAPVSEKDERWQLEVADAIRIRCVPWCTVMIGPHLTASETTYSTGAAAVAGLAYTGMDGAWILLAGGYSKTHYASTVHHEAFHIAESMMSADAIRSIDDSISPHAQQYGGVQYFRSMSERRCRLYQNFASMADEGVPVEVDVNRQDALGAFSAVYSGQFAQELSARNLT